MFIVIANYDIFLALSSQTYSWSFILALSYKRVGDLSPPVTVRLKIVSIT